MDLTDSRIKLQAARYFYDQIKVLYSPGLSMEGFLNGTFYVCDALIWELYAAFDLCLEVINRTQNLEISSHDVSWNTNFQKTLYAKNIDLFHLIDDTCEATWFKHLKKARKYITHHGQIHLSVERNGSILNIASIGTPGLLSGDGSVDLLDQLTRWIDQMEIFINNAEAIEVA